MVATRTAFTGWRIFLLAIFFLPVTCIGILAWRARHIDDFTRGWVVHELEQRFGTQIDLARVRVAAFPEMVVTGEDLAIHYRNQENIPPLIHIDKFIFRLGVLGIFRVPHRIQSIKIENMTITVLPRGEKHSEKERFPQNTEENTRKISSVVVNEIECSNTDLIILPKQPTKEPLDWDIHNLVLHYVTFDRPFSFHGTLTNGKPKGEIDTEGYFGPWEIDEPGSTPVSGSYKFTDADLDPFPGIAGTLSSTGKYSGILDALEVEGQTDTPDFSLDRVGKPVPLHTEYSATVDGTNGNTYLHPVRATLVHSLILAKGSIVKEPEKGHDIVLDVSAPKARIEDILSLAINSKQPVLTGPAKIKAKLVLLPGKQKVLEKMILDGQFGVEEANWSNPEIREKLEALSRHGEGKPGDEEAGSSISDLRGKFHLEKGVVTFSRLAFSVPGAQINLAGTYKIQGGDLDFHGHLRMQAKLSQTVTGAKSFFLKAVDPFFSKDGAGTVLPITISGNRQNPTLGVTVLHKTIKKEMGGSPATEDGKSKP